MKAKPRKSRYCKKCWSDRFQAFRCHACGKVIDSWNYTDHEYVKWGKSHVIGRCCAE